MARLYCNQGHDNPAGSRFCQRCGQPLTANSGRGEKSLANRYRLQRQLGVGGFGRTYLAEDTNRFNERCVIKEFAPQVRDENSLRKAEELFQREAGTLYKLNHPQIPQFRELCRDRINGQEQLFLVQDYVEGPTYRTLLESRMKQGERFREEEVTQLLRQLLPVLQYLHRLGVIHRDISPENLIRRSADGLPVLIDFGGVKHLAAKISANFGAGSQAGTQTVTCLGKPGYAPNEQIHRGAVYPHSDLYSLAATCVVLLTGREPKELIDPQSLRWYWRREVAQQRGRPVSSRLGTLLDGMLAPRPSDRFRSAQQVLQILEGTSQPAAVSTAPRTVATSSTSSAARAAASTTGQRTLAVAPPASSSTAAIAPTSYPPLASSSPSSRSDVGSSVGRVLGCLFLLLSLPVATLLGWWGGRAWLDSLAEEETSAAMPSDAAAVNNASLTSKPEYSREEQVRKAVLAQRLRSLRIDPSFYNRLVNAAFGDAYPTQKGRVLGSGKRDAQWRERWDEVAGNVLDQLASLSTEARQKLGQYSTTDRDRIKRAVNQFHLSSSALNDITDAQFFHRFPKQRGQEFIDQPIGQVWQAISTDVLQDIQSGLTLETLQFFPGNSEMTASGSLQPGDGKAYVAELSSGQFLTLKLQADREVLLSIYTPTGQPGPLLSDSSQRTWSGTLPESGYYEFVVVSTKKRPINYQLEFSIR